MTNFLKQVRQDMENFILELQEANLLKANDLLVVGCSTSEVAGEKIGTSGSEEVAAIIFDTLNQLSKEKSIHIAYQCCEHLNRAIVVEASVQNELGLEQVTVSPTPNAGGSMASYAFNHFNNAVVVEEIKADIGIDIGDTMIGMHLKKVAVPIRFKQKTIGNAHLTAARTRPKLIGGSRAQYPN